MRNKRERERERVRNKRERDVSLFSGNNECQKLAMKYPLEMR